MGYTFELYHIIYIVALSMTIIAAGTLAAGQFRRWRLSVISHIIFMVALCDVLWATFRLYFYAVALNMPVAVDGIKLYLNEGEGDLFDEDFRWSLSMSIGIVTGSSFLVASSLWTIAIGYYMYELISKPLKQDVSPKQLKMHHFTIWSTVALYWAISVVVVYANDGFSYSVYEIILVENAFEALAIIWTLFLVVTLLRRKEDRTTLDRLVLSRLRNFLLSYSICVTPAIATNYIVYFKMVDIPDCFVGITSALFFLFGFVNAVVYGVDVFCCVSFLMCKSTPDHIRGEDEMYFSSHSSRNVTTLFPHSSSMSPTSFSDTEVIRVIDAPKLSPTFVFTDIEHSTKLWQDLPIAMEKAQMIHDHILRRLTVKYRGYEVTTEGDAFFLAFESPMDAVQYCLAAQETLVKAKWPQLLESHPVTPTITNDRGDVVYRGLRVRMGIHTLPSNESVVCREHPVTHRTVYAGKGVYIAQDVVDLGAGGQILLSSLVQSEVQRHLRTIGSPIMMPFTLFQDGNETYQVYQIVPSRFSKMSRPFCTLCNIGCFAQITWSMLILKSTMSAQPEQEPTSCMQSGSKTLEQRLCEQLEHYFTDENLKNDLFILKNMDKEGMVKLELFTTFRKIKKLTSQVEMLSKAIGMSSKLALNSDGNMVKRIEPIAAELSCQGRLTRIIVAYNLNEGVSEDELKKTFSSCGEIESADLIQNGTHVSTGQPNTLKPPVTCGGTFALIEFSHEESAKHAVLTLSDQNNWRRGMQVVLFDGTSAEKLKRQMFPPVVDRRRAQSAAAVPMRPSHVEAVGEGLGELKEGKTEHGVIYSIRGAGGLINPTKYQHACISFRLIPADNEQGLRQGDHVTFTVGRNKKSGRKYASKVLLEFRPENEKSAVPEENSAKSSAKAKDYFSGTSTRWVSSRRRAATVSGPPPDLRRRAVSVGSPPPPRNRFSNAKPMAETPTSSPVLPYKQAIGPDGTKGFAKGRGKQQMEFQRAIFSEDKDTSPPPPPTQPQFAIAD